MAVLAKVLTIWRMEAPDYSGLDRLEPEHFQLLGLDSALGEDFERVRSVVKDRAGGSVRFPVLLAMEIDGLPLTPAAGVQAMLAMLPVNTVGDAGLNVPPLPLSDKVRCR